MRAAFAAAVVALTVAVTGVACAQPQIPSSEQPGRERERFLDQPYPPVPRIELRDGRPRPLFETKQTRPLKRRKCRVRGSKRC
jgi:hypothetical protein